MMNKGNIAGVTGMKRGEALDDKLLDQATGGRGGHNSKYCPECGEKMTYLECAGQPSVFICNCGHCQLA